MAVISGFTPAVESEGRQESLVLSLQALSRFHAEAPARPAVGYDLISALLGNMFLTSTSYSQPCPAWWILGSRDVHLDFTANAIGLVVEKVGEAPLDAADLETQIAHCRNEIVPAISTEIEAGRPVLVRGGFPGFGWGLWGVVTRVDDGKLFGHTCWYEYQEQPVGEDYPVLAAYTVRTQERAKRIPIREILLHAAELYDNKGEEGWTSGPGAYEQWIDNVQSWTPCSEECADLPNCHRQMALFVRDARMTAARFLDFFNEEVPPTLRRCLPEIVGHNRSIAGELELLAKAEDPAPLFKNKPARKKIVDALTRVREHEANLARGYAGLVDQKEWDAPAPVRKKAKPQRAKPEKPTKVDKAKAAEARAEKVHAEAKQRGWRKISD